VKDLYGPLASVASYGKKEEEHVNDFKKESRKTNEKVVKRRKTGSGKCSKNKVGAAVVFSAVHLLNTPSHPQANVLL
jgi:hypothetical protein